MKDILSFPVAARARTLNNAWIWKRRLFLLWFKCDVTKLDEEKTWLTFKKLWPFWPYQRSIFVAVLPRLPRLWISVTHPNLRPNHDFVFSFEKVTPQRNFVPKWVRVVVKRRPMWIPTSWYGQKCNYFSSICIFVYFRRFSSERWCL